MAAPAGGASKQLAVIGGAAPDPPVEVVEVALPPVAAVVAAVSVTSPSQAAATHAAAVTQASQRITVRFYTIVELC